MDSPQILVTQHFRRISGHYRGWVPNQPHRHLKCIAGWRSSPIFFAFGIGRSELDLELVLTVCVHIELIIRLKIAGFLVVAPGILVFTVQLLESG